MENNQLKNFSSVLAYKKRCQNFYLLKNGLIEKFVDNALDLEDRQQQSLFHLTDGKNDDFTNNSGYFHACTAFGKSYLIKAMAEGYFAEEKNKKVVIFEENVNVLKQIKKDLLVNSSFNEDDIGTYYGGEKILDTPILVATYASMEKLLHEVKKEDIGLVLCDEAHHILSKHRQQVARDFDNAALYGFTATPHYDNDKECAQVFGSLIDSVTIRKGVESNLLCSFKNGLFVSHIPLDITEAKTTSGEYDPVKLAQIMRASHVQGMREELADFYLKSSDKELGRLYGKATLINVPSQEEANLVAETFNQKAGQTIAKAYHTNTDEEPLKEFNEGKFPVLVQVNKLSEGYNNKKIEICINYPTCSKVRSAQRSGRALRRDDNNPEKLALIVDVAFKRRQSNDVLQEIHDNGQVLFMDVAEEGAIYSEAYRRLHPEIDLTQTIAPDFNDTSQENKDKVPALFDVITDYRDIYKLMYNHLEVQEMRVKQPYDLAIYEFSSQYDIFKAGRPLSYTQRRELFDELVQNPQFIKRHIVKNVLSPSNGRNCWTIDSRRLNEIAKELNLGFVFRDLKKLPLKTKTDIMKEDFDRNFDIFVENRNECAHKQKRKLFDELCDNKELLDRNLIRLVRSNVHQAYAIDGTKLDEFMKISGIKIKPKPIIEEKSEIDLGQTELVRHYNVVRNGVLLTKQEKIELYKQLMQDTRLISKGVIKTVTARNLTMQVVDGTKLDEFTLLTGIELRKKNKVRDKGENDISRADFIRADYTITQNGKQLVYKDKVILIAKLLADLNLQERGIVISIKDKDNITSAINGEKLNELFELTGIDIKKRNELAKKRKSDISLTHFRSYYRVVINGKELNFDEKSNFFDAFCHNDDYIRAGYIKNVQSNGHPLMVIDGDLLEKIHQRTGVLICEKTTVNKPSEFDIGQSDFARKYVVFVNGEAILDFKQRSELFTRLISEPKLADAHIVKRIASYASFVIDTSRLNEIKDLIGIDVTIAKQMPQKLEGDISKFDFIYNCIVQKDGKRLSREQSGELFDQWFARKDELSGIFKLVQSNTALFYVIDGHKLDELSKSTGISITPKERHNISQKEETDILLTSFIQNCTVSLDGKLITNKQKSAYFDKLTQNEQLLSLGIVRKVQTHSNQTMVIDSLQLDKLLELTGVKITLTTGLEKRKSTDINRSNFIRGFQVMEHGNLLSIAQKEKLFDTWTNDEELERLNIVRKVISSKPQYGTVIDGTKLEKLQVITGLQIITPQQKMYNLQEMLKQAKTVEEKQKYQKQLQSMFRFFKKSHIPICFAGKQKD